MKSGKILNICFICDEPYALPTMVAIQSIKEATKPETLINIHVVGTELSNDTINSFKKLSSPNITINALNIPNQFSYIPTHHQHVSKAAMLKFALPRLFPNLDKLLYVDGDMLFFSDLTPLYNTNLSRNYAAVVPDMAAEINGHHHTKLGLKHYFNSGMMLLNLKKMRLDNLTDTLIQNKLNDSNQHFMDQDTLNKTFKEKVIYVSPKWNFMPRNLNFDLKEIALFYGLTLKEVSDIYKNYNIWHLTNKQKPWNFPDAIGFKIWWKYFKHIPFCPLKTTGIKIYLKLLAVKIFKYRKNISNENCEIFLFNRKVLTYRQPNPQNEFVIMDKNGFRSINKKQVLKQINKLSTFGVEQTSNQTPRFIVSLTSYPERISTIHYTLFSLLRQSIKPNELILWLGDEKFPNKEKDLPQTLLRLKKFGLTIKWCQDIRAYTKLLPALREYPDDIIITADDDIFYPRDWLEKLCRAYYQNPSYIHCHWISVVTTENNKIMSPKKWLKGVNECAPSFHNFLLGVGGVLYPPHSLHKDVFNEKFKQLSPLNDDIWFWAMAVLNNTKINLIPEGYSSLTYIDSDRELGLNNKTSLQQQNIHQNYNDNQIANVAEAYPKLLQQLKNDNSYHPEYIKTKTIFPPIQVKSQNSKRLEFRDYEMENEKLTANIKFSSLKDNDFRMFGFSGAEKWGRWSKGFSSQMVFTFKNTSGEIIFEFNLKPFLTNEHPEQQVLVYVNDKLLTKWYFSKNKPAPKTSLTIPQNIKTPKGKIFLKFEYENPCSPYELGISQDMRKLAIGFISMKIIVKKIKKSTFFWSIIQTAETRRLKLFHVIPLYTKVQKRSKKNEDLTKIYILGMPVYKIRQEKYKKRVSILGLNYSVYLIHNEMLDLIKQQKQAINALQKQISESNFAKEIPNKTTRQTLETHLVPAKTNISKLRDYVYYKNLALEQYPESLREWYFNKTGKTLNLDNPQTFNEKIQWLKLYDSTPLKTRLADKYLVRDWVKEKIGEQYLIPLLGVYDSFDEIDFDKLPDRFVMKCNHGSGWNIIVKDKTKLDKNEAKEKLNRWLKTNFAYVAGFELHYRDIKPKIIIEEYMDDGTGDLRDYKYTCFNGKPEFIWIDSDRHSEHKRNLYDLDWKQLNYKVNSKYLTFPSPQKPKCLKEMTKLAEILSAGFPYVRVDFYIINNKIYFGEMTFTSSSGTEDINPVSFDKYLANKIKLPKLAYDMDKKRYYKA